MLAFKEIYHGYEQAFRQQLLDQLYRLSPNEFEHFARKLLNVYGFNEVKVTQATKDGGIDGQGNLQLGLATMRAAFQCKRWKGNVGRTEVDKFRGAIQGEFEQGIFFTTGDYTKEAKNASIKKGAVPIILLNGSSIVDLMIEKELGVEKVPLYIYRDCLSDFMVEEAEKSVQIPSETENVIITKSEKTSYTGQSITAFTLAGSRYEVKQWKEVLVKVCEIMVANHSDRFEKVLNIKGRKRPYFSRNSSDLRASAPIRGTNIYVEKNMSSNGIVSLAHKVISSFGYENNNLSIETKENVEHNL